MRIMAGETNPPLSPRGDMHFMEIFVTGHKAGGGLARNRREPLVFVTPAAEDRVPELRPPPSGRGIIGLEPANEGRASGEIKIVTRAAFAGQDRFVHRPRSDGRFRIGRVTGLCGAGFPLPEARVAHGPG